MHVVERFAAFAEDCRTQPIDPLIVKREGVVAVDGLVALREAAR